MAAKLTLGAAQPVANLGGPASETVAKGLEVLRGQQQRIAQLEQGILSERAGRQEDAGTYERRLFAERRQQETLRIELGRAQERAGQAEAKLAKKEREMDELRKAQVQDREQMQLGLTEISQLRQGLAQERERSGQLEAQWRAATEQIALLTQQMGALQRMHRETLIAIQRTTEQPQLGIGDYFARLFDERIVQPALNTLTFGKGENT
jgi:hypothetical protein